VNETRLRILGAMVLAGTCLFVGVNPSPAQVKSAAGKIAGVVNDTQGVPQLGATVEIVPELTGTAALDFLTNTQGVFRGERLAPGFYTVRVTLAGFLPTLEQHVRISAHLTTVVRIQLESMFASLDQLRRAPSATTVEADDWKWVLRSASVTRPILQWMEGDGSTTASNVSLAPVASVDSQIMTAQQPRTRLEFTDGARQPGSSSNIPSAPATAFAYDQKLGGTARLLVAGQMNYLDSAPGGGLATVWLPTGSLGSGPYTALVLREAKLGPDGQTFRGVHMEQGGSVGLGDRTKLLYSGEYVLVGLTKAATSLRPRLELDTRVSDDWHTALIFAEEPGAAMALESDGLDSGSALATTLNELDSFPALLWRAGRPELEGGWHEEAAAERKLASRGELQIAAFHDDDSHVAVYGRGSDLPPAEYLPDYFSGAFAYDGGSLNSWGARVALRERLTDDLELTTIYAFAGALGPSDIGIGEGTLREMLRTSMHNSIGANVTVKVPHAGTKVTAGYKWVSGVAVSRLDGYGESLYQMDPYLHVGIRQRLPRFGLGHWEAIADCDNILAQGYVSMSTQDGRTVLVPAFRTFRGGLSVQF
jgi:hypothetical protein